MNSLLLTAAGGLLAGVLATLAIVLGIARRRRAGAVAAADGVAAPAAWPVALDAGQRLAALQRRLTPAHPISGLPVREVLLAQMTADRRGLLGALAFADVGRLTAFDPASAEQLLAITTARLRQMLPTGRVAAQVDRGHIGFWYPAGDQVAAQAELDAMAYALAEEVILGEQRIVPQIEVRLARFDPAEGLDAGAFVARTLASFAVPTAVAATVSPATDFAGDARDRYTLEQDLRRAVARQELRLLFQPLIDAGQSRVSGAEALIRWEHPDRGAISPDRFIPIVEAAGLADEIGSWVLNTAVREAQRWTQLGLAGLRVAVNVSSLQLESDELPILVQRTLQRHDASAALLEVELTESVATSDAVHCRRVFQALRTLGVKLAVDDFGTGYSGFSSLRTLAFDKIKIDREFVTDVDRRPDSQAICQSIIALGRGLNIRVLAEGVERRAEYEWLRRHGCHHFQGYYFGEPMDGPSFAAFVRDTDRLAALLRLDAGPARVAAKLGVAS